MWLHRLHVHVCAIARADDAAGDIVCACVCPPVCTATHWLDTHAYLDIKILGCQIVSEYVSCVIDAYTCDRVCVVTIRLCAVFTRPSMEHTHL